jgi:hypothetical protein
MYNPGPYIVIGEFKFKYEAIIYIKLSTVNRSIKFLIDHSDHQKNIIPCSCNEVIHSEDAHILFHEYKYDNVLQAENEYNSIVKKIKLYELNYTRCKSLFINMINKAFINDNANYTKEIISYLDSKFYGYSLMYIDNYIVNRLHIYEYDDDGFSLYVDENNYTKIAINNITEKINKIDTEMEISTELFICSAINRITDELESDPLIKKIFNCDYIVVNDGKTRTLINKPQQIVGDPTIFLNVI